MNWKQHLPLLPLLRDIKRKVRSLLGRGETFHVQAFSQEGEDLILRRIFEDQANGFYVDIGAHHPLRFSNTYLFYRRGWRGINVDAMPGSMEPFSRLRPRDTNIEVAVARESGPPRKFWIFNEPALNTFDEALARSRVGGPHGHAIIGTHEVPTRSLCEILDEHLPAEVDVDYLTVDVEGLDLEVLQSNNWDRYRPKYVLAECYGVALSALPNDAIHEFLVKRNYEVFAKTVNTVIFCDTMKKQISAAGPAPLKP